MSEAPDPYETIKTAERERAAPSSVGEDGLELTGEQSLQTIAVELHRANLLKQQELQMRERALRYHERQTDLVANLLDLIRKGPATEGIAEAMREYSQGFLEPIQALLDQAMKRKPSRDEKLPAGEPATVESESGGIRVAQQPES